MLHPFMPFVTEELWHAQGARPYELIVAKWPEPEATLDKAAKAEVEWVIGFVKQVRSSRTELGVSPGQLLGLTARLGGIGAAQKGYLDRNLKTVERLARLRIDRLVRFPGDPMIPDDDFLQLHAEQVGEEIRRGSMNITLEGFDGFVPLEGLIDIAAEQARLAKAREASLKERDSLAKRLENPAFVEKAKPEAVDKARADHAHHAAEAERLEAALARLG